MKDHAKLIEDAAKRWAEAAHIAKSDSAHGLERRKSEEAYFSLQAAIRAGVGSGEPVAYRHLWPADEECGTDADWEYFDAPTGEDCTDCQPLYTHPQPAAQAVKHARKLYECVACKHLYEEKVNQCDCLENPRNQYNEWSAFPKAIAAQGDNHE